MRESSLRLGVGESSGGIESLQLSKKRIEGWCLEALKRRHRKFVLQAVKFRGKTLWLRVQKFLKGEWTIGIIRGEFSKSRKPSDIAREKGGYGGHFLQAEAQEREGRIFTPMRTIGSTRESSFQEFVERRIKSPTLGSAKLRSPRWAHGIDGWMCVIC
jgi:hypothetical protein